MCTKLLTSNHMESVRKTATAGPWLVIAKPAVDWLREFTNRRLGNKSRDSPQSEFRLRAMVES